MFSYRARLPDRGGFTLLELLVVLVLVGLLAGIGVPRFVGAMEKARLRAAASDVSAALRGGRILALEKKGVFTVTLDLEKNRAVPVEGEGRGSEKTKPAGEPLDLPDGIALWEDEQRVRKASVTFYPTGSSGGVELFVTDEEAATYEQKNAYVVVVDMMSGRTRLKPALEYLDEKNGL